VKDPIKLTKERQLKIAKRITESLEAQGMTQRQLAEKTGMLPSAISRILHAQTNLTLKTIAVLERALGIALVNLP